MNPGYLILHPKSAAQAPHPGTLIRNLRELGLIGRRMATPDEGYLAGSAFLQLVTYLGCSPSIPLSEDAPEGHCSLHLLGPYTEPALISGRNSRPPRCPHCRHVFQEWGEWPGSNQAPPAHCPRCGAGITLGNLEWREQGGVARLFLLISQVFPGEAVPGERLMKALRQVGGDWQHAYVQEPRLWCVGTDCESI